MSTKRTELRHALHDELATLRALNQTLRQPSVHDGQRSQLHKARGVALLEITRLLRALSEQPPARKLRRRA